mgnify:CR=1 FL=1
MNTTVSFRKKKTLSHRSAFSFMRFSYRPAGHQAFCAGTNLYDILHIVNEDLAVTDMTGIQNLLDRFNNGFNRNLGYNNLHLHLRQQSYVNLSAR